MVQVWARDPDRVRRGQLTVISAKCVLRETGVGTWQFVVDESTESAPKVQEGWGVVVVDEGRVLFSGPVESIGTAQEGQTRDSTLSGVTDMCALGDRLVLPDPSRVPDAQTTVAHWSRKGPAEDLIAELVNTQAGPGNPFSSRRVPGLVALVSQGRGAPSSVNARYSTVLEEVQTLATVGGLVVDVVQDGTDLVPTVRSRVDRSRAVRFQERAGLSDYEVSLTAPTATVVLVAGQGEGTARQILFRAQSTAWGRRVEVFQDRRDTADVDELGKAAAETLAEGAESGTASFTVEESTLARFGVDYELGDTVTVALPGGGEIVDGVRAAEITWDPHGRTVELTVGAAGTEPVRTPAVVAKTKKLMRQVRGLEKRR